MKIISRLYMKIAVMVVIALAAGAVGSVFTAPAIGAWYSYLAKPFFTPPNWAFAPVWTILYILMAVAAALVWQSSDKNKSKALKIYFSQLALNVAWSLLFFGLRSPFYALIGISILWLAILFTIFQFNNISKKAGMLLIPYILWTTLAAFLNISIFILNG
jgi:translocator protein